MAFSTNTIGANDGLAINGKNDLFNPEVQHMAGETNGRRKLTTYLMGPMAKMSDGDGHKQWRQELAPKLDALGIRSIDPWSTEFVAWMKEEYAGREEFINFVDVMRGLREFDALRRIGERFWEADAEAVRVSDFGIVRLLVDDATIGTIRELQRFHELKKPVFALTDRPEAHYSLHVYDLILTHGGAFFTDADELLVELQRRMNLVGDLLFMG